MSERRVGTKTKIKDQVWFQVRDKVAVQIWEKVAVQVWDQVWNSVMAQGTDRIREQVRWWVQVPAQGLSDE